MEENNQAPQVPDTISSAPITQSIPQDSNISKPKSKLLLIIIGIVLFLLITGSAAGFYLFKGQIIKETPKPTTTKIVTKPSPTQNATTNWKTYEGTEFSIKYPPDYTISVDNSQNILVTITSRIGTTPKKGDELDESELTIAILASENTTKTLDEIIDIEKQKPNERSNDPLIFEEKSLSISGLQAKMLKTKYSAVYYVIHGNMLFKFIQYPPATKRQIEFDQILSTFKFTDTQTVDTSNWKTYTGKGFSIKYPATWNEDGDRLITTNRSDNPVPPGPVSSGVGWIDFIYPTTNFEETVKSNTEATTNEEVILDNVKSRKLTGYGGIGGSVYGQQIITQNAGQVIVVSFSTQDTSSVTPEEVNQILSTFKFTK